MATTTTEEKDKAKNENNNDIPSISFYITGFGKFGGIENNPTTTIVQTLQEEYKNGNPKLQNIKHFSIVKVAASSATEEVDHIMQLIQQEKKKHAVILHLGVNPRIGQNPAFQLEKNAYNEANFRIPDEESFQPRNETIDPTHPDLGFKWSTDLNVKVLQDRLAHKGFFDVCTSGDAGRFVCNYIYFRSLNAVQQYYAAQSSEKKEDVVKIHVLFVHVPKFEGIPQEIQVDFSKELIDLIQEMIVEKEEKKRRKQLR